MKNEIIYFDEMGSCYSEETNKTAKEFFKEKFNLDYTFRLFRELNIYKGNWNKLKEYINYKKSIYDKRIPTEFCTYELIGKRMLAEELISKIEKIEKGVE